MQDFIRIKTVNAEWVGYDNPSVEVTVKSSMDEFHKNALRQEIAAALLRWGAITQFRFTPEINLNH